MPQVILNRPRLSHYLIRWIKVTSTLIFFLTLFFIQPKIWSGYSRTGRTSFDVLVLTIFFLCGSIQCKRKDKETLFGQL